MSTTIGNNGAPSGISSLNLAAIDLETALLSVQTERSRLLDGILGSQIADVQARNDQIAKLNNALSSVTGALSSFSGDAKADTKIKESEVANVNQALSGAGLSERVSKTSTKGDLDKLVTSIKGQIDGMNNSQQMDMLRLQALSNKRNEAFDVMTNFIKKMQDSRSSIIGNMR